MKRTFDTIIGFLFGLGGFAFLAMLGGLMYMDIGGRLGIFLLSVCLILGILMVVLTTSMVGKRGFLENRAALFSTPLLDEWLEKEDPNLKKIRPKHLPGIMAATSLSETKGELYFWGDSQQFGLNGDKNLLKSAWNEKKITTHPSLSSHSGDGPHLSGRRGNDQKLPQNQGC